MAISKDASRQYPLVARIPFTVADVVGDSGVQLEMADIPANARVIGGEIVITTVFNSAVSDTIIVGDGADDNRYLSGVDGTALARTTFILTGYVYTAADTIDLQWTAGGAVATTGAGHVLIEYVIDGRANEVIG